MPVIPNPEPQDQFVALDTHVELAAGLDAKQADGTGLSWYSAKWPDLAGATLTLTVGHKQYNLYGDLPIHVTSSVPTTTPSPSVVHVDVPGALTATLPGGQYDYQLDAQLVNGDSILLASGHLSITAEPNSLPTWPPSV